MNAIYSTGVIRNGCVELAQPLAWPEGTEVIVMPSANQESDAGLSAEEIAQTLAAMDRVLPMDLSDEELADWEAHRRAQREFEKANFDAHGAELQRNWE
ncbi:MAG: hypothetical protein ACKVP0_11455 [Pirellulaceae bacterium]